MVTQTISTLLYTLTFDDFFFYLPEGVFTQHGVTFTSFPLGLRSQGWGGAAVIRSRCHALQHSPVFFPSSNQPPLETRAPLGLRRWPVRESASCFLYAAIHGPQRPEGECARTLLDTSSPHTVHLQLLRSRVNRFR